MPQTHLFASRESRIVDVKSDLSRISKDRLISYREGRIDEATRQQFQLLEAELRNIEALASYVNEVSAPAGHELVGHLWTRQIGSRDSERSATRPPCKTG